MHGAVLGIDVEVVKRSDALPGFVPVRKRWIVEQVYGTLWASMAGIVREQITALAGEVDTPVTRRSVDINCLHAPDGNDRPADRRARNTMRRLAVLGATVLMLSGCSLVGGSSRNEEIPPKPLAKELCDAMGDAVLRVVYTRYGQTPNQTPAQRVTKAVDELCDDMRSGTWAEDQARFNRGFRADPMGPPGTGATGTCKISGRYDVVTKPHAKVSLVFGLKGEMVDIGLSKELSGSAELDGSLVKLMGTELTMLAIELVDGRL